jgi:Cyclic nucleotide-binding domain.
MRYTSQPDQRQTEEVQVIPWFTPKPPTAIRKLIFSLGSYVEYKKNQIVLHEYEKMNQFIYIERGLFAQAVINYHMNKQLAMNLFMQERLMGYLTFFSGKHTPRRIFALENSVAICASHQAVMDALNQDFSLYKEMARYCELADRSELNGMMGLFMLSIEDRLRQLFVAMLCASGYVFRANQDEWVALPFRLRRADILKVIYASQITLDRIMAEWVKNEYLRKKNGKTYVRTGNLYSIYKWISEQ